MEVMTHRLLSFLLGIINKLRNDSVGNQIRKTSKGTPNSLAL